jgi:hypothetical protein
VIDAVTQKERGAWRSVIAGVVVIARVGGADRWMMKKPSVAGARAALVPARAP